jgi:hypothetical protein
MKGLNFYLTNPNSNLDMACALELVVSKHPQTLGMEFRWKIRSILVKSKCFMLNMTKKEFKNVSSLRLNKVIRILQANKDNCVVVFDEYEYKDNLNTLLESGVYELLPKDATAKDERKVQKLIYKHKTALPTDLKCKSIPYYSKAPHLHGLPEIHIPNIPLRPIVSSIHSPCYALVLVSCHYVWCFQSFH